MKLKFIISFVTALLCAAVPARALTTVQQADSAYNKKDFQAALYYYQNAMQKDGTSSDLYYNIGNTYYRLGDLGHAVLSYKRALALNPSNEDAATNLEFVKTKITDKPEDDSTFLWNMHHRAIAMMSPDAWAWTAFGIFVTVLALFALYLFAPGVRLRKVGFFGGFIVLFVFGYALVAAWSAARGLDDGNAAVVIVPTTNLRSTPATSNSKTDKVVPIHEGTEVRILDSLATPDDPATPLWYDVKINNTSRAWLPAGDVEKV